jgi:hypothetical protein
MFRRGDPVGRPLISAVGRPLIFPMDYNVPVLRGRGTA